MRLRNLHLIVPAVALAAAALAARPALALPAPVLVLDAGRSFGADDAPDTGGLSLEAAPLWTVGKGVRFGVAVFADDIGTDVTHLRDPNNGVDLGLVASLHRWTWGAAWRADADVKTLGKWTVTGSGTFGYWRIVDDHRGDFTAAASAVGAGLGLSVKRPLASGQQVGLALRGQRLFTERNSAYRRVQQYANVALEWSWAGAPQQP